MAYHCAVSGCSNGQYRLIKWRQKICEIHEVDNEKCSCKEPFRLISFPGRKKDPNRRKIWKLLVNRESKEKKILWSPGVKSKVCSNHFKDTSYDYPTLDLGYDAKKIILNLVPSATSTRHLPFKSIDFEKSFDKPSNIVTEPSEPFVPNIVTEPIIPNKKRKLDFISPLPADIKKNIVIADTNITTNIPTNIPTNINNIDKLSLSPPINLDIVAELSKKIKALKLTNETLIMKNNKLTKNNKILRKKIITSEIRQPNFKKILTSNKNTLFYTGIQNIELFNEIHDLVAPLVRRKWYGSQANSEIKRKFKKFPKRLGAKTKLCSKDEMLLTLMKLRLGLMEQDLANRFEVSTSLASRIFVTWVKGLASVLKNLIYIPDKGSLNFTKPDRFNHIRDLHSIIDGSEIFIETPKNPDLQKVTWSEYKHHNTVKILVYITPNSTICFVSDTYPGSISDKKLTKECGYLDKVPPYSYIMADKGFNIENEYLARNTTLYVPPGKRGSYQMLPSALKKTKRIANLRILVEQVIRQMKTFKILSYEYPIKLLSSIDDVVTICSALCNLLPPIFKD